MDRKLDMSQPCALAAQKANCTPGCIKRSMASRSKEVLCSGEVSPGVLYTDVEPSVQERHRPLGARPEKSHKNDPWNGTHLLREQAERAGSVQPGEEKAPR